MSTVPHTNKGPDDADVRQVWGALTVVTLVALALRLYAIEAESIWLDEAYTYARAKLPLSEVIAASIKKHHNPTYFVFMHFWIALGDSELWLRLPSAIFGALTAAMTCAIGNLLSGPRVGLVAGLVLACMPTQVYFGQEARMYTFLTFAASVALWGLLWLVQHPAAATAPRVGRTRIATTAWFAYALGTLGALYLHNTAVFVGAALGVAGLCAAYTLGEHRGRFTRSFLVVNALVLCVFGLYVGSLVRQAKEVAHNFWDSFPTLEVLGSILRGLYLASAPTLSVAAVAFLIATGTGCWSLRKRPGVLLVLLCTTVLAPLALLLVSLHTPMFGTRLMLWTAVPWSLLVACGVAAWPLRLAPLSFVALVALVTGPTLVHEYETATKEPFREILQPIVQAKARGEAKQPLIVAPTTQEATVLDYYFHRKTQPLPEITVKLMRGKNIPSRMRALRGVSDVWLIDRKRGTRTAEHLAALQSRGELVRSDIWGDYIRVVHVRLRAAGRAKNQVRGLTEP